MPVEFGMIH